MTRVMAVRYFAARPMIFVTSFILYPLTLVNEHALSQDSKEK
jgi:hypothetical protein